MPSSISFDATAGFIAVVHHGIDDQPSLKNILLEVVRLIKEHGCYLILSDYRDAVVSMTPAAIYEYPKEAAEAASAAGIKSENIKQAVVLSDKSPNLSGFQFYETVSLNRGRAVKVFCDIDQAIEWLTGK
ncbi:MAG: hypothetical protein IPP78_04620 [Holophagaceae bacterium]|nr:hypothetical protein [Holophagaceae bacterium]